MGILVYIRLIGYTAGTLLQLFWMVVILGYRRQRNFERVFFFLCLALFLFYGGSLLALNAQIYYATPTPGLTAFSWTVLCAGLCFLPPLLVHLHLEYAETRGLLKSRTAKRAWLTVSYAPVLYFGLHAFPLLGSANGVNFMTPASSLGRAYGVWLILALIIGAEWERRFGAAAPDFPQELFHHVTGGCLAAAAVMVWFLHVFQSRPYMDPQFSTALAFVPIVPLATLIYLVQKYNFLQIGRQRNLVYAVTATFLALLYLSLVRRVSSWLEPMLPPEASAAILLFVLVVFFEPLQRLLTRRLHETAQSEMDRTQRIIGAVQEIARQGNIEKLRKFIEEWLRDQLEFAQVQLAFIAAEKGPVNRNSAGENLQNTFPIRQAGRLLGTLHVQPHGAGISGETRAALEFLCEQLPGALDLCRLIEEKLRLERELAKRERLALVGQMAASISHNLKNPLGSIKTILQVQMENPELPESMRRETQIVLEEIGRLSTKLNQLLQFSRPAVLPEGRTVNCDACEVAREVISVLRSDAQSKGVALELNPATALNAAISAEALNDILTNLVVNALDAAPRGGHVQVGVSRKDGEGLLVVEDDGPGVPAELREKILQPFFTTKTQGTGLGLAIAARRASDAGGKLEFESPLNNSQGTRFLVRLPLGAETP